jgi:hypothetical protein
VTRELLHVTGRDCRTVHWPNPNLYCESGARLARADISYALTGLLPELEVSPTVALFLESA